MIDRPQDHVEGAVPLVSACLIVKDEQDRLPACLASLRGLVDEVVVYDTGSVDGTVAIARAAGATVHQGYWDDDFARARNAALDVCRGQWILHIDADEVLEGDAEGLRADLRTESCDVLSVAIDNVGGPARSVRSTHHGGRLFKRTRGRWAGRLHEQVVPAPGHAELTSGTTTRVRFVHVGYGDTGQQRHSKLERNVDLARAEAATDDSPLAVLNLARSLVAAGNLEEGLALLTSLRSTRIEHPVLRRRILRSGAECQLALARPLEALSWIKELRRETSLPGIVDYLEATALVQLGQPELALAVLDRIHDARDEDGNQLPQDLVTVRRGLALFKAERWREAVDVLVDVAPFAAEDEPVWSALVTAAHETGTTEAVARTVPPAMLVVALGQALASPVDAADAFGEALWQSGFDALALVPFGATIAVALPLDRALEWAARIRQHGAPSHCPLLAIATTPGEDPERRITAAAIAVGAFGDEAAVRAVADPAALVDALRFPDLLLTLDQLAPSTLPAFVQGAAATPARCRVMADALAELGAGEQAAELRDVAAALEHSAGRA